MNPEKIELERLSIVLIGSFNPKIFHPAWLSANGLIRSSEAETAEKMFIHNNVSVFELDWMSINVTPDRFTINTLQPAYYEIVRDLVSGMFEILEHTPMTAMGVNFESHYGMSKPERLRSVSNEIIDIKKWESIFDKPELNSLSVKTSKPEDLGYYLIRVEESIRIANGLYIQTNDHTNINSAKEMREILLSNWKRDFESHYIAIDKILDTYLK
ncbi:MAG: hypothetical protein AAF620_18515 [Bacteroidota bacterium]